MPPKPKITTVDDYIAARRQTHPEHADALAKLRRAVHTKPLEETIKWGAPCYVHKGKNVVGLAAFKSYVGLWFHQGALLTDPDNVLVDASEGKTKALRQWRFTSAKDIKSGAVKAYVKEAVQLVEEGREIKPASKPEARIPPELAEAFRADPKLKAAFDDLTPGKRRDYADHITEAKREATKTARLEKIIPMIRSGVGLHDKYRNC